MSALKGRNHEELFMISAAVAALSGIFYVTGLLRNISRSKGIGHQRKQWSDKCP